MSNGHNLTAARAATALLKHQLVLANSPISYPQLPHNQGYKAVVIPPMLKQQLAHAGKVGFKLSTLFKVVLGTAGNEAAVIVWSGISKGQHPGIPKIGA